MVIQHKSVEELCDDDRFINWSNRRVLAKCIARRFVEEWT